MPEDRKEPQLLEGQRRAGCARVCVHTCVYVGCECWCLWGGYGLCVHVLGEWRVWVYACGSTEAWVCRHACVSMSGCGCAHECAYVYVGVCLWGGYGLCVHVLGEWRVWVYACGSTEAWVCRHACVSMSGCGCAHECAYVYVGVGVHMHACGRVCACVWLGVCACVCTHVGGCACVHVGGVHMRVCGCGCALCLWGMPSLLLL